MKVNIVLALFVLSLSSCGGGGGGGGGGGSGKSASTGVRILHGSVDTAPVDVLSSAKEGSTVTSAYFAENTFFGSLPEGEQILSLTLKNSPATIIDTKSITVENGQRYSLLYYGNEFFTGVATSIISDNPGEIPEGQAAVKVVHALAGASKLDVAFSDGQTADGVKFGEASPYIFVAAGSNIVNIRRASDGLRASSITHDFAAGQAYTILMTGETEFFLVARIFED